MTDRRTYIRVHDGLMDHPKIQGLSNGAFRALIGLWCWSSRYLTDGRIVTKTWTNYRKKYRDELINSGLVSVTDWGVQVHDYLEHQRSADEVTELRKRRAEAGRRGGIAKAKHLASAKANAVANAVAKPKQTPSKNVASTEVVQVPSGTCTPKVTPNGATPTATPLRSVAAGAAQTQPAELTLIPPAELTVGPIIDASPDLTLNQRSKRITDEFAAVEPMCRWPAVNGIVKKAIQTGKYGDTEIRDAIVRLGKEGRSVSVESLRVELNGIPPSRRNHSDADGRYERGMARALAREAGQQ